MSEPTNARDPAAVNAEMDVVRQRIERLERRLIAFDAAADQDLAACAEAERCGCPIYVDVIDGEDVTGSARVVHECHSV